MSSLAVFLLTTILAPGCNKETEVNPSNPPGQSNFSTPASPTITTPGATPSSTVNSTVQNVGYPWEINLSFPNGAPPLNQTAELVCTVKNHLYPITDMHLQIGLPDALELISGNLSWSGDIPTNSTTEVMKTNVKSVKTGYWTVDITGFINPDKNPRISGIYAWPIYVSISKDEAEWRIYPPYRSPTTGPLPTSESGRTNITTPPPKPVQIFSSPIAVKLTISKLPSLNEPVDLTLTITSNNKVDNCNALIELPKGAALIEGNLEWRGNLQANIAISYSVKIVFKESGKWEILGWANYIIDEKNGSFSL